MAAAMSLLDRGGSVVMIEKLLDDSQDSCFGFCFYVLGFCWILCLQPAHSLNP